MPYRQPGAALPLPPNVGRCDSELLCLQPDVKPREGDMRISAAVTDRIGVALVILGLMAMPLVASTHLPRMWHVLTLVLGYVVATSGGYMRSRARRRNEAEKMRQL